MVASRHFWVGFRAFLGVLKNFLQDSSNSKQNELRKIFQKKNFSNFFSTPVFLLDPLGFGDFLPISRIDKDHVDRIPGLGSHLGAVPFLIIVKLADETFTQAWWNRVRFFDLENILKNFSHFFFV